MGPSTSASAGGSTGLGSSDGGESTGSEPFCGDGFVDDGESCDEDTERCTDDCQWDCGVLSSSEIAVSDTTAVLFWVEPEPIGDGSGGWLVPSSSGGSRVDAMGTQVWIRTSWTGAFTTGSAVASGSEFFRAGYSTGGGPALAWLSRHDASSGDAVAEFELLAADPGSHAFRPDVALLANGDVIVSYNDGSPDVTSRVERRGPDGSDVSWMTELPGTFVAELVVLEDDAIWLGGNEAAGGDSFAPSIAALDPDGSLAWSRVLVDVGAASTSTVKPAALPGGGGVVLTTVESTQGFDALPTRQTLVMRLDEAGDAVWEFDPTVLSDSHAQVHALVAAPDDRIALGGAVMVGDAADSLYAYLDATDGTPLCASLQPHRSGLEDAVESLMIDDEGNVAAVYATHIETPNANNSQARYLARLK